MKWFELSVTIDSENTDMVSALLYDNNVGGLSIEDDSVYADASRNTAEWDVLSDDIIKNYNGKTIIKAYFSNKNDADDAICSIQESLGSASANKVFFSILEVDEEDWANNWKKYYNPVEIGKDIIIVPSWEKVDTKRNAVISLDPGMAFGTGTHETTVMCLELLEKYMKKGFDVLDIGTGSGILSIAAAKLSAKSVTAVDIDKVAVKTAKENIELNGVSNVVAAKAGDLAKDITGQYDIVIANIIADAIALLADDIYPFLKNDSIFIASGIINTKLDKVKNALDKNNIVIIEKEQKGDWLALVCALS